MSRLLRWTLAALALLVFCSLTFADSGSHVRIVRLSYRDGDVRFDNGDGQPIRALLNMPITHDSTLRTGADGRAEVEFEDGTQLRLTPNSELRFTDLSLDPSGHRNSQITLQHGSFYFEKPKHTDGEYELIAGGRNIAIKKPAHLRITLTQASLTIAEISGEAMLAGAADGKLRKGETLTIDLQDNAVQLAKRVTADVDDAWDDERGQYHDDYFAKQKNGPAYGFSDLNFYGTFFDLGGSSCWRPYAVSLGWDPFAQGYWVWYPGPGYVFVSSQPWGWAPFRYGAWRYAGGYGWCWYPGRYYWNTWYPVPPVHHPPQNWGPPKPPPPPPPSNGGGTGTGPHPPHPPHPPVVIVGGPGSTTGPERVPGELPIHRRPGEPGDPNDASGSAASGLRTGGQAGTGAPTGGSAGFVGSSGGTTTPPSSSGASGAGIHPSPTRPVHDRDLDEVGNHDSRQRMRPEPSRPSTPSSAPAYTPPASAPVHTPAPAPAPVHVAPPSPPPVVSTPSAPPASPPPAPRGESGARTTPK